MGAFGQCEVERLLTITLAMIDAAEQSDWVRVQRLDGQRRQVLEEDVGLRPSSHDSTRSEAMRSLVSRLLQADRQLLACASAHRDELASATARARASSTARQSYHRAMTLFQGDGA